MCSTEVLKKEEMMRWWTVISVVVQLGAFQVGCGTQSLIGPGDTPTTQPQSLSTQEPVETLAARWEYQDDAAAYPLVLNEQGNGPYAWKDGYLTTTNFSHGVWKGTWYQRENDREGAFEVRLSQDYTGGEGRWWYTRIGSDTSPEEPGGTFRLTRGSRVAGAESISTTPAGDRSEGDQGGEFPPAYLDEECA